MQKLAPTSRAPGPHRDLDGVPDGQGCKPGGALVLLGLEVGAQLRRLHSVDTHNAVSAPHSPSHTNERLAACEARRWVPLTSRSGHRAARRAGAAVVVSRAGAEWRLGRSTTTAVRFNSLCCPPRALTVLRAWHDPMVPAHTCQVCGLHIVHAMHDRSAQHNACTQPQPSLPACPFPLRPHGQHTWLRCVPSIARPDA
jgi:hypothetical protein